MAHVINILTTAGGDFTVTSIYDAMLSVTEILPGQTSTHFVLSNASSTLQIDLTGSGFTYLNGVVTGGAYTKAIWKVNGAAFIDFNYSPAISMTSLISGLVTYSNSGLTNHSALDALFSTQPTTINGNIGDDVLYGLNNVDTINGGAGNDILIGGAGADILNPGATKLDINGFGFETLVGNAGNDTFNLGTSAASHYIVNYQPDGGTLGVNVNLATNTATDTFGNTDSLVGAVFVVGTSLSDSFIGDITDDFFAPGGGTDTINGGGGIDELDYFFIKQFDTDAFTFTQGITVNQSGDNAGTVIDPFGTIDTFTNVERIVGTRFADTFNGSAFNDAFIGGDGIDTFNGGLGIDEVTYAQETVGGGILGIKADLAAHTVIDAYGKTDVVNSIENITGTPFADVMLGDAAANTFVGGRSNDIMDGKTGIDTLIGGLGDDAYYLNDIGLDSRLVDTITELANQGIDGIRTIVGVNLNEVRFVNVENAYIVGTTAANLGGSAANNVLVGNDSANLIAGLGGRDIERGGLGADIFKYFFNSDTGNTALTRDLIQDFTSGTDKIDLSAMDANGAGAGNGTFVFQTVKGAVFTGVAGQLHYLASGANTLIEGDFNGDKVADIQIELTGIKTLTGGITSAFDIIL